MRRFGAIPEPSCKSRGQSANAVDVAGAFAVGPPGKRIECNLHPVSGGGDIWELPLVVGVDDAGTWEQSR